MVLRTTWSIEQLRNATHAYVHPANREPLFLKISQGIAPKRFTEGRWRGYVLLGRLSKGKTCVQMHEGSIPILFLRTTWVIDRDGRVYRLVDNEFVMTANKRNRVSGHVVLTARRVVEIPRLVEHVRNNPDTYLRFRLPHVYRTKWYFLQPHQPFLPME